MSAGPATGSAPLSNEKHERYCILRLTMSQADAWQEVTEKRLLPQSARTNGSRVEAQKEVRERLAFLRRQHAALRALQAPQNGYLDVVATLRLVSERLRTSYLHLKAKGGKPGHLNVLKKCWAAHSARMAKLPAPHPQGSGGDAFTNVIGLAVCKCLK